MRKVVRIARLEWHKLGDLKRHPHVQRAYKEAKAVRYAKEMNLEILGMPTINVDGAGNKWILDGQHRIAALKMFGFSDSDLVQCETYHGLDEAEMAEIFLGRDDRTVISAYDKFKQAILAKHTDAVHIDKIVHNLGLTVARNPGERKVRCTSMLRTVYAEQGPQVLSDALGNLDEGFFGARQAFDASIIQAMAWVLYRYGPEIGQVQLVTKLQKLTGGIGGFTAKANTIQLATRRSKVHCYAAAFVDAYNAGRKTGRLESWWT